MRGTYKSETTWVGFTLTLVPVRTPDRLDDYSALELGRQWRRDGAHLKALHKTRSSEVHGKGSYLSPGDENKKMH